MEIPLESRAMTTKQIEAAVFIYPSARARFAKKLLDTIESEQDRKVTDSWLAVAERESACARGDAFDSSRRLLGWTPLRTYFLRCGRFAG
jgi:hypothetical protein